MVQVGNKGAIEVPYQVPKGTGGSFRKKLIVL